MMLLLTFIKTREIKTKKRIRHHQNSEKRKSGRPRKLANIDEFFIVMCRLRRGFAELHLANLSGVSQSSISRLFTIYVNYMYLRTGQVNVCPSRALVGKSMPDIFKEKYPNTRVIIDCTEIRCQMTSGLLLNSELLNSYKSHVTFKVQLALHKMVAPHLSVNYIPEVHRIGRLLQGVAFWI